MARTAIARQIVCQDWRMVPDAVVQKLFAAEQRRWEIDLDWDLGPGWDELEMGRQLGTVGGLIAYRREGRVAGWAYYLVDGGALQIGGFNADSEVTTAALIEDILADPAASAANRITAFAFTDAPGLVGELRSRGLAVDRYFYLRRDVPEGLGAPMANMRAWTPDDLDATAALLQRAFESKDASRPFAPDGTIEQWQQYVKGLVTQKGCGELLPSASFVVADGPGRLAAVALVTRIGPTTGHIAQLAVDPLRRRRHFAAALVEAAWRAAARLGCTRTTLLVGGRNQAARTLYQRARFESVGSFIAAGGAYPRRSTSVAPGGVIITRR